MGNIVYSIIWLLLFIFISFFVAYFCAGIYVILYIIEICIPPLSKVNEVLLQGIQFPRFCVQGMLDGKPLF